MTDRQREVFIIVGLFGLCFLFLWFASLLYSDSNKGDDNVKKETNHKIEQRIKRDSVIP